MTLASLSAAQRVGVAFGAIIIGVALYGESQKILHSPEKKTWRVTAFAYLLLGISCLIVGLLMILALKVRSSS